MYSKRTPNPTKFVILFGYVDEILFYTDSEVDSNDEQHSVSIAGPKIAVT